MNFIVDGALRHQNGKVCIGNKEVICDINKGVKMMKSKSWLSTPIKGWFCSIMGGNAWFLDVSPKRKKSIVFIVAKTPNLPWKDPIGM